ncbi:MAG: hypothetical protein NTY03_05045 [Candidatus Bathyarchaeota archaeon]|nr:hypothetical protein [Candidatus Bathyarchaeota archaeon]
MDMTLPSRPPKKRESYHLGLSYNDHESVVQPDGRIAVFEFSSAKKAKGWVFAGWKDAHDFGIWDNNDRARMWDKKITIQEHLIESKGNMLDPFEAMKEGIGVDETAYHYVYGGPLAQRGGIFVVKTNDPRRIIRAKMTWLS